MLEMMLLFLLVQLTAPSIAIDGVGSNVGAIFGAIDDGCVGAILGAIEGGCVGEIFGACLFKILTYQ